MDNSVRKRMKISSVNILIHCMLQNIKGRRRSTGPFRVLLYFRISGDFKWLPFHLRHIGSNQPNGLFLLHAPLFHEDGLIMKLLGIKGVLRPGV